jgi:hypothetical protein
MLAVRKLFAIALSCGLGACAIHPLPENVTGVKTTQIVHRIRCETRDAVLTLANYPSPQVAQAMKSIAIVYSFSLQGTDSDSLMPSATFVAPVPNGMWTFNPAVGDSVMRQNVRTFTIVDNFDLLSRMDARRCTANPPNYQYPIVGNIGIAEMMKTFVALAAHADLTGEEAVQIGQDSALPIASNAETPTMVDTISFTTMLSAGVTPTLALTPVGSGTQLTGAALGVSFSRNDVHQVIIGLALPAPIVVSDQAGKHSLRTMQTLSNQPRAPLLISGVTRNAAERAALDAVNDQIIRFQLPRPVIVTP